MILMLHCILGLMTWTYSVETISTFQQHRYQQTDGRFFSYQNSDGQFHLGNWTIDGTTTGSFGWLDKLGIETALQFIADDRGYRILRKQSSHSYNNHQNIKEYDHEPILIQDDPSDPEHAIIANKFNYITGSSFRVEQRRKTGIIYGKYGFVDGSGRLIIVYYTAHARRGFLATRQVLDPNRGQTFNLSEVYQMPLRDVAAEFGLRDYYRSASKE